MRSVSRVQWRMRVQKLTHVTFGHFFPVMASLKSLQLLLRILRSTVDLTGYISTKDITLEQRKETKHLIFLEDR